MSEDKRREDPWFEHMEEDDDYIDIISIAMTVIVIAVIAVGVWIGL